MNYLLIRDATDIGLSAFTSGNNSGILDSGFIDSIGHGTTLVVNDTDVGLSIFASGNDGGILTVVSLIVLVMVLLLVLLGAVIVICLAA